MTLVILSNHIGLSWVGVEATTLFSAPLIYYHMDKKSLEAVWKYLIICSVGIALALVGTFFIYAGLKSEYAFFSKEIDFSWFKIGFIFAFIGYATKAGIVPMHTWLVDAHSQAPSHISALLSGTLLNCALITIYKLSNPYINSDVSFVYDIFLFFGSLSVITPAILSLNQKEFKRLLAYSSIENMGVSLVIMGLNKYMQDNMFVEALLVFNLASHSLSKVFLFLTSGIIMAEYGEKRMDKISLINNSVLKWMWFFGLVLILGIPPSGLLITKMISFNISIKNNFYVFFVLIISFILMGWSFSKNFINMCFNPSDIKPIKKAPVSMYITSILTGIYAAFMMFFFFVLIDL
jgi:hydrogenase-4 component F